MEEKRANLIRQNRNLFLLAGATACLLLGLFLIKEITHILEWGPVDFVFVGVMVFGTGTAYELIARKHKNRIYRVALAVALGAGFIMIWANLAVGLIGSEDEPANLMYLGLLAVGLIGALIARLKAPGMSITMGLMAVSQVLITVTALLAGFQHLPHSSVGEIVKVNSFFFVLWSLAGLLFWRAKIPNKNKI